MKERLKMIFDRIDIFVVCIVFGCCLTIAEAFIGTWGGFVLLFIMTSLITGVCYTLRCNEKLAIELIEAKKKLKEAEKNANGNLLQLHQYSRYASLVCLYRNLWREKCRLAEAKVLYCKRKLTTSYYKWPIGTYEDSRGKYGRYRKMYPTKKMTNTIKA